MFFTSVSKSCLADDISTFQNRGIREVNCLKMKQSLKLNDSIFICSNANWI